MKLSYRLNLYKRLLFFIVLPTLFYPAFGQIHANKQKALGLNFGLVDGVNNPNNKFYQLLITNYHQKRVFLTFGGYYQTKSHELIGFKPIKVEQFAFTANIGQSIPLNRLRRIWLNNSIGACVGYEWINIGNYLIDGNMLISNKSKVLIGLSSRTEVEAFLTNKYSFSANVSLLWQPISTVQSIHFQNGIGLKYHFF